MNGIQKLNRALLGMMTTTQAGANIIADRLEELEADLSKLRKENKRLEKRLQEAHDLYEANHG